MARTGRSCREDNEDDVQFPIKPTGGFLRCHGDDENEQ